MRYKLLLANLPITLCTNNTATPALLEEYNKEKAKIEPKYDAIYKDHQSNISYIILFLLDKLQQDNKNVDLKELFESIYMLMKEKVNGDAYQTQSHILIQNYEKWKGTEGIKDKVESYLAKKGVDNLPYYILNDIEMLMKNPKLTDENLKDLFDAIRVLMKQKEQIMYFEKEVKTNPVPQPSQVPQVKPPKDDTWKNYVIIGSVILLVISIVANIGQKRKNSKLKKKLHQMSTSFKKEEVIIDKSIDLDPLV